MKAVVDRAILSAALSRARKAAPRPNRSIPIHAMARLEVRDGQLEVRVRDIEGEYQECVEARTETPGAICADLQKLDGIATNAPEGSEIGLAIASPWLSVSAGRARFRVATLPAEDWPETSHTLDGTTTTFDAPKLVAAIKRCLPCVAPDSERDASYKGIWLQAQGDQLAIACTNRPVLVRDRVPLSGRNPFPEQGVILPASAANALCNVFADVATIEIQASEGMVVAWHESKRLCSHLIAKRIPDYEALIGRPNGSAVSAGTADLKLALSRIQPFGDADALHRGAIIGLQAQDGELLLAAEGSAQTGAELAVDRIEAETPDDWRVTANARFFRMALDSLGGERVEFHSNTGAPGTAMLLVDPADENFRCVVGLTRHNFPALAV